MSFVLIHGGAHGAWCWAPLIEHLKEDALAIDLPGRGRKPADLSKLDADAFARSVVEDIEQAGIERCVLVGHSLAGITMPRVAELIPERIAHLAFVSCCIPADGQTVAEALASEMPQGVRIEGSSEPRPPMEASVARAMFCNDMDEAQTSFVLENLCAEAGRPLVEPTRLAGLEQPIERTYIKLLRDQSLSPALQDRFIRNAGKGCRVKTLDAGHNAMISRPRELAAILEEIHATL
jgi:pimeloyl-ACP methyl ester carboxylesterase